MKKAALVLGLVAANLFTVNAFAQTKPDGTAGTVNQPNMTPANQPSIADSQGLVGKQEKAQATVDRKAEAKAAAQGPQKTNVAPDRVKVEKVSKDEKVAAGEQRKADAVATKASQPTSISPDPTGVVKPSAK
ncbi:MAG: hypothetical protein V4562_00975 [Pseudomonadota bacterium]